MEWLIFPCGCPIEPGQVECPIKEPHATIACFGAAGEPGEPGEPGEVGGSWPLPPGGGCGQGEDVTIDDNVYWWEKRDFNLIRYGPISSKWGRRQRRRPQKAARCHRVSAQTWFYVPWFNPSSHNSFAHNVRWFYYTRHELPVGYVPW